jgi:hypothetical protein
VTTIRPNVYPQQTPLGGQRDDAGKLAAQRAFFEAAMARASGTAAPSPPVAPAEPAAPPRTAQVAPSAHTEAPQRIARPGSLLDIRV